MKLALQSWAMAVAMAGPLWIQAQSADWQQVIWRDHEMVCLEAVRRTEEGFKITNLNPFERKQVNGKTLIPRKGSNDRVSGMQVALSSD